MNTENQEVSSPQIDSKEANLWATLSHISVFAGWIPVFAMQLPFIGFNVLFPLFIFLLKKNKSEDIELHARESTNFQITATFVFMVMIVGIAAINKGITEPGMGIKVVTFGLMGALMISVFSYIALVLVAAINAFKGKPFHYLVNIRFIK